ncbi:TPA: hypothetical protein I4D45_24090 [Enterobacter hormaechei]|nr:hypothetical protein MC57_019890 [Enterobacter hormaechei]TVS97305.1 hypothetical protein FKN03_003895 [Enterobacter hormaechei]HAS1439721.1 hypothetical protein [Enterobacter hormaechei]HAS1494848.1 hypothetical protein [Enterobacter hormaechei]HAS1496183.1 hypothetical protein [Enterobacter hormaechei]
MISSNPEGDDLLILTKWYGYVKSGFSIGDPIDIDVKIGCINVSPSELVKYSLENLIEGFSAVNLHNRVDFRSQ